MELQICTSICELSKQPQNRASIVKDQGCLPGLVLFLDNVDTRVTATALEAMKNLASCVPNRKYMREELGMIFSLQKIITEGPPDLAVVARGVYEAITAPEPAPAHQKLHSAVPSLSPNTGSVARTPFTPINAIKQTSAGPSTNTPRGQSLFASKTNKKKSRTLTLQITKGFNDPDCQSLITQKLLKIKGIVSFTFDSRLQRAFVRATYDVKAETICDAISDTKVVEAQQVVRGRDGGEVVLSFGNKPSPIARADQTSTSPVTADSSSATKPEVPSTDDGYLDEEELEEETVTPEQANMAVATWGTTGTAGSGWLGEVGGYLAQALYW